MTRILAGLSLALTWCALPFRSHSRCEDLDDESSVRGEPFYQSHVARWIKAISAHTGMCCLLTAIFVPTLLAQTTVGDDVTTPLAGQHAYIHFLAETVTPSNGQVALTINIPTPSGRLLNLPFSITYNSNGRFQLVPVSTQNNYGNYPSFFDYTFQGTSAQNGVVLSEGGWSYSLPQITATDRKLNVSQMQGTPEYCHYINDVIYFDSAGVNHFLGVTEPSPGYATICSASAQYPIYTTAVSGDSFYTGALSSTGIQVSDNSGTVYTFRGFPGLTGGDATTSTLLPSLIEDRNGNQVTINQSGSAFSATDTLGRPVLTISSFGSASDSINVAGLSTAYDITWQSISASGPAAPSVTILPSYTSQACASTAVVGPGSVPAIQRITLPNGQAYNFSYDPIYGTLSQITYPNGGWVKYTWGVNKQAEVASYESESGSTGACAAAYDTYAVKERDVSYDGTTVALKEMFAYTTTLGSTSWTNKTTVVTDQDQIANTSTATTYTYTGASSEPTDANDYMKPYSAAPQLPGEPQVNVAGISSTVTQGGASYPYPLCQVTTLNGIVSSGYFNVYQEGIPLPVEKLEYDYGIVTPQTCQNFNGSAQSAASLPTPTRDTKTTYATFAATAAFPEAPSLKVFPQSVTVTGTGGNSATTTYAYDQSALVSVAAVSHDGAYSASSSSPRGNVTTITQSCSPNCTNSVTTNTYDQTGQVTSTTDPCGMGSCANMGGSNHTTTYSYIDQYAAGTGSPSGNTNAYLTTVTRPAVNGINHVVNHTYGFQDGHLRTSKDENGQTTTYCYFTGGCSGSSLDPLGRLTEVDYPDGGVSSTSYQDAGTIGMTTTIKSSGPSIVTTTLFDGMGRPKRTELVSDPKGPDYTDTVYNGVGEIASVSNPYRATSDVTYGLTSYQYDAIGRKTSQTQADGSIQQWNYSGNTVIFRNENGSQWQRTTDALGRLTSVLEPNGTAATPSLETDYAYDALDNLVRVDQWGGSSGSSGERVRRFSYDSLSRLIASFNPEKVSAQQPAQLTCSGAPAGTLWSECFSYDANGNETSHTDNRNITTTLQYDSLNRVTNKQYSDGMTPPAVFLYDVPESIYVDESFPYEAKGRPTNVVGRLAFAGVGTTGNYIAASSYSYDAMGRVVLQSSCTPRTCGTYCDANGTYCISTDDQYDRQYAYDVAGNMTFAGRGYLSRRNYAAPSAGYYFGGLSFAYNGSSQPVTITSDLLIDATPPNAPPQTITALAANLAYSPLGGITGATVGTVFQQTWAYSRRGQMTYRTTSAISGGGTLTDTFGWDPAGNLQTASDTLAGGFAFCYDTLNRLTQAAQPNGSAYSCPTPAAAAAAGTDYTYDAFGNLTARNAFAGSTYQGSFVPTVNNQNPNLSYDAAGNMTNDGLHSYTYDAENQLISVDGSTKYYYDAERHRVAAGSPGQTASTDFLYDLDDRLVATVGSDYKVVRTNLYGAGQHWADFTGATTASGGQAAEYRLGNEVGTLFLKGDGAGNFIESCVTYPFGEALNCSQGIDYTENHFVDKKRDSESGLDYMGARFYNSSLGRFMSPDPGGVAFSDPANPQSWNLYSYVQNNPLTNTDPDGHDCVTNNGDGTVSTNTGDCGNENDAASNREFYINCDGCTANSTGATLDSTTGDLYLTDANGNGIAGTNVLGFADPAGPSAQTGASTSTSGINTTIDIFGTNWQSTQFRHGTHPYRDNNPGDIVSGRFVNGRGAIGADGRFGVFPSAGQGKAALDALLHGPAYNSLTVSAAIERYAPGFENNTAGYQQFIQNVVGVSGNAPLSSLSSSQFSALENGISRYEGFSAAGNYSITTSVTY